MENDKNNINDTTTSNNKTMEYYNSVTKSIINQTGTEIDNDMCMENEAIIQIKKAEHKLKKKCCLNYICYSKKERLNDACELFKRAGDKFKVCNQWRKAGACYENCAIIKNKLKEKPINYYILSYQCFSKIDIGNEKKNIFEKMNYFLEKDGEFYKVGKNYENLAIQKENKKKYDEAIKYYLQAIKYYDKAGNHEELKTNIQIKVCELMILNNHPEAGKKVPNMLENIAVKYYKNPLKRKSAKDYFGKAILCNVYFRDNPSDGNIFIDKYKKIDKTFKDSEICDLCCNIVNNIENNNFNQLNHIIQQYKDSNELDDFMDDILDKIIEKEKSKNTTNIRDSISNSINNSTNIKNDSDEEDTK